MNHATGAMGSLLSKLFDLLKDEYKLQKGVKEDVEFLTSELKSIHAALNAVGEVPWDQLDEQVRVWADEVRELSYDMEDVVDSFMVRVEDPDSEAKPDKVNRLKRKIDDMYSFLTNSEKFKWFKKNIGDLRSMLTKGKPRHQIGEKIKGIKEKVKEVADRRDRYKIDSIANQTAATKIDPRVRALYTEVTELVGIYGDRDQELMKLLAMDGNESNNQMRVVSVVGFGGLGKTTLVRAVYNKINSGFNCSAFVPVGRNADVKKVFRNILRHLNKEKYTNVNIEVWDESLLIDEVEQLLKNKRYIVVIDDIWEANLWEYIKCAFPNSSSELGSRVITTTRIVDVAKVCCAYRHDLIYHMEPLTVGDSKQLFHKRIFSSGSECPSEFQEVSEDILKKCGGVPLAIITIASLLASDGRIKPLNTWVVLLSSMGRGLTKGSRVEEMYMILCLSFYDLPCHLKTCLLYLSIFPEDHEIPKDELIWRWICERFITEEEEEASQYELGEAFFNDLINRSLIQPVFYDGLSNMVFACRIHDMVLDLICSLSRTENFVTIWDGTEDSTSCHRIARRISIHKGWKEDHQAAPSMSASQVRSITVLPSASSLVPPLSSFDVLRVLDLSGCDLANSNQLCLGDVGNLLQLRYLDLCNTGIHELPAEMGKLQVLQVLDIRGNNGLGNKIPSVVCRLTRLRCLYVDELEIPDGFGSLTYLEMLWFVTVSRDRIKELFSLTRLRMLEIEVGGLGSELEEAFVEFLGNLSNINFLLLSGDFASIDLLGDRWEPPHHLRFFAPMVGCFSAVPAWIKRNPTVYWDLSWLFLIVKELQQEDMLMIGRLPALRHLDLKAINPAPLINIDGFPLVMQFELSCRLPSESQSPGQIMFLPGALPIAEKVEFDTAMPMGEVDRDTDFDFGLRYLPSLRHVRVRCNCAATVGEADREKAKDALDQALGAHPNHPSFDTCVRTARGTIS